LNSQNNLQNLKKKEFQWCHGEELKEKRNGSLERKKKLEKKKTI
jgi:hypothetical protein